MNPCWIDAKTASNREGWTRFNERRNARARRAASGDRRVSECCHPRRRSGRCEVAARMRLHWTDVDVLRRNDIARLVEELDLEGEGARRVGLVGHGAGERGLGVAGCELGE